MMLTLGIEMFVDPADAPAGKLGLLRRVRRRAWISHGWASAGFPRTFAILFAVACSMICGFCIMIMDLAASRELVMTCRICSARSSLGIIANPGELTIVFT